MESIPKDEIFKFNDDTLQYLRKQYNLDTPGRIEEAINALEEWIKKQSHFVRKEYPRDYLERTIIISKGSVERAKTKLDKICTFRTLFPNFFGVHDVTSNEILEDLYGVYLPKLTQDNYRVYFLKNKAKRFNTGFMDFYRYFIMQCEYLQSHDYCNGLVLVIDYTEANLLETTKWFNLVDLRELLTILKEGYGLRLKSLHFLSESKAVETIVALFKQVLSAKLRDRVNVHKTTESLHEYIPKEILPIEYQGQEKSLLELHKLSKEVLTSSEFSDYLRDMSKACTDEALRIRDNPGDHTSSIQGTFRTLSVD
ncbi:unnamed protein product [Euphydryas editha]|uniref:CRAL-TRIO domain-containing protein n=1 Tax=Euphydryas editha TaxID=104508 RepID=A0AAU9U475_EUPED|nr:unnamed protein product [Euphydryas editha]